MRHLHAALSLLALAVLVQTPVAARAEPRLIASPAEPGPDMPPAGRSLFDALFEGDPPFPFERLLAEVEEKIAPARLRTALIPLGRSLQRFSADPDYFASPRLVVAVDSDPIACTDDCLRLKDRLFFGYQARAESIEVISYNEDAGRFEFQVVEDYGPDSEPTIIQAERAICVACHQGHAPIFATALWRETDANPRVAARLKVEAELFHGVMAGQGIDDPDAFDQATDRSSRIALAGFVWQQGCGEDEQAVACRGALLQSALRFRLGGSRVAELTEPGVAQSLHDRLATLAPNGLAIPSPDLPDRDPMAAVEAGLDPYDAIAPGPTFDPEKPRKAMLLWRPDDAQDQTYDSVIRDIAELFAPWQIAGLSSALAGLETGSPARYFRSDCSSKEVPVAGGSRSELRLDCDKGELQLRGHLAIEGKRPTEGRLRALRLGDFPPVHRLSVRAVPDAGSGSLTLTLQEKGLGLAPRLPGGERLTELALRPAGEDKLMAVIGVIDDVAALDSAIRRLVEDESPMLGEGPLRPGAILAALSLQLSAH